MSNGHAEEMKKLSRNLMMNHGYRALPPVRLNITDARPDSQPK